MIKTKIITLLFTAILALLVLGNPSEKKFLQAVADDFGTIHHGAEISSEQLAVIGTSRYRSFLFFSTYEYAFGTIKVRYYGVGFMTFFQGSSADKQHFKSDKKALQS